MNRRFALLSGAAALLGGGYFLLAPQSTPPVVPFGAANAQSGDVDTSMVTEMSLGDPDADVTVIEYASFTCPHCKTFHQSTFKDLKREYIDTGKIHFIYREVYFDRFGLWAAMVARCAGEDRYFGLAELIYDQQADWTAGSDPATVAENLRRIGRTAGLSDEQLNDCLQNAEMAQALVAKYQENAEADDVRSTPTFIINGEKYSNMGFDEFSRILDEELAG